ncbi:unnamed protein product [Agarophyton chilense]
MQSPTPPAHQHHQQPPRREKIIAPAIYFTPASSSSVNVCPHPVTASKSYDQMSLPELQAELEYLVKSVTMLLASNSEMHNMDPHHSDPDLTQAIGENVAIILRRNAAISRLRKCIKSLQPHAEDAHQSPQQHTTPQSSTTPATSHASTTRTVTFARPENERSSQNRHHGLYL